MGIGRTWSGAQSRGSGSFREIRTGRGELNSRNRSKPIWVGIDCDRGMLFSCFGAGQPDLLGRGESAAIQGGIIAGVAVMLFAVLGPLLVFIPVLGHAKSVGLRE